MVNNFLFCVCVCVLQVTWRANGIVLYMYEGNVLMDRRSWKREQSSNTSTRVSEIVNNGGSGCVAYALSPWYRSLPTPAPTSDRRDILKCCDISEKSPNGIMCYMNKQVLRILEIYIYLIYIVKRLELLPGVTTLFRDFTEGLSLVPLITLAFYPFL